MLKLRSCLQGSTINYSVGLTVSEICATLRAVFGLTAQQARERLSALKRDSRHSLMAHAMEVHRLVGLGYSDCGPETREVLAIDCFRRSVANLNLQRFLLTIRPATLREAAVRADEWLGAGSGSSGSRGATGPSTMVVETIDNVEVGSTSTTHEHSLEVMAQAVTRQAELLDTIATLVRTLTSKTLVKDGVEVDMTSSRPPACCNCGGPHWMKDCAAPERPRQNATPKRYWSRARGPTSSPRSKPETASQPQQQGNELGPAQE